jgi:hypothetical protein
MIRIAAWMLFLVVMSLHLARKRHKTTPKGALYRLASQVASVVAILAVISVGIVWIGADPVLNRVTQGQQLGGGSTKETFYSSRGGYGGTMTMIGANPLPVLAGRLDTAVRFTPGDGSIRVPQAQTLSASRRRLCRWPLIASGRRVTVSQPSRGAFHRSLYAPLAFGQAGIWDAHSQPV